jgi:hypothetical protein
MLLSTGHNGTEFCLQIAPAHSSTFILGSLLTPQLPLHCSPAALTALAFPTSNTTILTLPAETSPMEELEAETSSMEELEAETSPMEGLEGLEDITIQPYVGIANMREIVKSQFDKLEKDDSHQQYLVFRPVTVDDLDEIDRARDSIGNIRMTHYTDTGLLIVKLLLAIHEVAVSTFANIMVEKLAEMKNAG